MQKVTIFFAIGRSNMVFRPTILASLLLSTAYSFQGAVPSKGNVIESLKLYSAKDDVEFAPKACSSESRRGFLNTCTAAVAGLATSAFVSPIYNVLADEESVATAKKVLVLGGTGMVGKEVVRQLREKNIDVVSTSRDGRDGTATLDFTAVGDIGVSISKLSDGCSAIISCVGSIGTDKDGLVNSGSGKVAEGAPSSVKKFVYVSVAPEVKEASKGVSFLNDYMEGKSFSEAAIESNFGNKDGRSYTLIKPTFIYGGDEFKVNPPRVATGYGKLVEGLLSTGVFRAAAGVLPGIIGIALEPPVNVEVSTNVVTTVCSAKCFFSI